MSPSRLEKPDSARSASWSSTILTLVFSRKRRDGILRPDVAEVKGTSRRLLRFPFQILAGRELEFNFATGWHYVKMLQLVVIFAASILMPAQQQRSSAATSSSTIESPLISAKIRSIADRLGGRWSVIWMDKDARVIGEGEEEWKIAPDSGSFIEENRSIVNGKSAHDYAAMWWDSKAQKVHGIWCNTAINDESCNQFDVTIEDTNVVLSGTWEFRSKLKAWRRVFTVTDATMTQTLFIGEQGKELKLASTIRGTKR